MYFKLFSFFIFLSSSLSSLAMDYKISDEKKIRDFIINNRGDFNKFMNGISLSKGFSIKVLQIECREKPEKCPKNSEKCITSKHKVIFQTINKNGKTKKGTLTYQNSDRVMDLKNSPMA